MMYLSFRIQGELFAIEAGLIVEIIPKIPLTVIPEAPTYIPGVFNYRGDVTPAVDLAGLLFGEVSKNLMSTRILILNINTREKVNKRIGLIAEDAIDMISSDITDEKKTGVNIEKAPYLSKIISQDDTLIQIIDTQVLIPYKLHGLLFSQDSTHESDQEKMGP